MNPEFALYPFVGLGQSTFFLDSMARMMLINTEVGVGADYFLPKTPIVVTVQLAYNHSFNVAVGSEGSSPNVSARLNVGVLLFNKRSYIGFE